jgi:DNA helicase MCM9
MQANQLRVNNEQRMGIVITDEMKHEFGTFWHEYAHTPMAGRDVIIKSICPQVRSFSRGTRVCHTAYAHP